MSEVEKANSARIAQLEESLKKKKQVKQISCLVPCRFLYEVWMTLFCHEQDDKTFSILRKTLGSFLGSASDEEFPPDDWDFHTSWSAL